MQKAFHVALKITRNREHAEAAAQQGFLSGYAHVHQFQGQSKFSSWLLRFVINEAVTKIRQRKHQGHYLSYDGVPGDGSEVSDALGAGDAFHPEALYSIPERRRVLGKAIDSLRSASRIVVQMLGLEEKQTDEVA